MSSEDQPDEPFQVLLKEEAVELQSLVKAVYEAMDNLEHFFSNNGDWYSLFDRAVAETNYVGWFIDNFQIQSFDLTARSFVISLHAAGSELRHPECNGVWNGLTTQAEVVFDTFGDFEEVRNIETVFDVDKEDCDG